MDDAAGSQSPRLAKDPSQMRIYRACVYCRQRKTKCHLDNNRPPCQRCVRENRECVLGGSNRGRPRKSRPEASSETRLSLPARQSSDGSHGDDDDSAFAGLQNPSDALGILAQVADENDDQRGNHPMLTQRPSFQHHAHAVSYVTPPQADTIPYQLCTDGYLTTRKVHELVERYEHRYHPYFPIVPSHVFNHAAINDVALNETNLLTAILLVSSKDNEEDSLVHNACSEHMQRLMSGLAIGMKCGIEAVEALLILAEWTPHQQNAITGSIGRGEEDRAAWMYVGMALRIGYFLGLDLTSFRSRDEPKDDQFLRNRFVWTACYMSDRQISTRVGRAFWSRGPGPWTNLTKADFPMLQPKTAKDENYSNVFQATLELTQIFTNVHDILYARRGPSLKAVLMSDYVKYIDDFRMAIKGWNSVWGTLTCSPNIKATLLISYDYLRLYTNAFAFQATFSRKLLSKSANPQLPHNGRNTPANHARPSFASISSNPDARFIFEALDSAKSLLVTVNNFLSPSASLRYMPLKYYLYIIYSAVFLYKARFLSVGNREEMRGVRDMIGVTIERLAEAGSGAMHPGRRYAGLLRRLWGKIDSRSTPAEGLMDRDQNMSGVDGSGNNLGTEGQSIFGVDVPFQQQMMGQSQQPSQPAVDSNGAGFGGLPVNYDFNWLDLDAVGQFAMDESGYVGGYMHDADAMWLGFGMEPPAGTGMGVDGSGADDIWGGGGGLDGNMFF